MRIKQTERLGRSCMTLKVIFIFLAATFVYESAGSTEKCAEKDLKDVSNKQEDLRVCHSGCICLLYLQRFR